MNPRPLPRIRNVLARKPGRDDVDLTGNGGPLDLCDVAKVGCARISRRKDQGRMWIDFRDVPHPLTCQRLDRTPQPPITGAQFQNRYASHPPERRDKGPQDVSPEPRTA